MTTTTTPAAVTIAAPPALLTAIAEINGVESKHDSALMEANTNQARNMIAPAFHFAQAFDAYAIEHGLVSKAGNIVDSKTQAHLEEYCKVTFPSSQSTVSRALRIGRYDLASTPKKMWDAYMAASWTQPTEAVPEGVTPESFTNAPKVTALATWSEGHYKPFADKSQWVLVDEVLMSKEDHAARTAVFEPEPEADEVEGTTGDDTPAPVAVDPVYDAPPADKVTNRVNVGALSAVFASCDAATVEESMTYEIPEIDDVEEMTAYVLSAVATLTMMIRGEQVDSTEAAAAAAA